MKKSFPFRILASFRRSLRVIRILLCEYGMFLSFLKRKPVDANQQPIPWITYPALEYLKQFDLADKHIFEYGAGNSTLFWSTRAKSLISVESSPEWYASVSDRCLSNAQVLLATDREEYVTSILKQNKKFDLISIDGQWRNRCLEVCVDALVEGGMIILDNSDRNYIGGMTLRTRGFFQVDFSGFGPFNDYSSTTSIFIKAKSHLQQGFKSPDPIGGLTERAIDDD